MSTAPAAIPNTTHPPSAFGDDIRRFWTLTWVLAVTDFKLKFFGSALGYLWSLVRPLLLFTVLYVVFTKVFKVGQDVEFYPVYLLTSIILWTFFAETTTGCVTCLVDRENLLRKIRFPRMVIPLSVALTALFNLALNLVVVAIFIVFQGVPAEPTWLLFPVLIFVIMVLAIGAGMLVSALYVRYRDVQPIWDVCLQVLFYATPILYVATKIPPSVIHEAMLNPLACVMTQMRHWILQPEAPSAMALQAADWMIVIPAAITVGVFVLGLFVFTRAAPRIAEDL